MKNAFVTGANRGLGFEIARQLGANGFHVLVGARDVDKATATVARLEKESIATTPIVIDVSNPFSIEKAGATIAASFSHLDVLVNNAGILNDFGETASTVSMDALRESFETNFFGAFATTQTLLPLIKNAPAGRIVSMSSDLGSLEAMCDPGHPQYDVYAAGYQASKCALNVLTCQLAKELRDTAIKVNSASPGLCQTDMGGPNAPLSVAQGAATAVWLATLDDNGPTGGFFSATLESGRHPW